MALPMNSEAPAVRPRRGRLSFAGVPPKVRWLILLSAPQHVAGGFFFVAVSAYLPEIGLGSDLVGLILGLSGLSMVASAVPLGLLSDRRGRKGLLLAGSTGVPAIVLLFAFTKDPTLLMAGGVVLGVGEAAFLSTWNALVADGTPVDARNEAFSLSFIVGTTTVGLGFATPPPLPPLPARPRPPSPPPALPGPVRDPRRRDALRLCDPPAGPREDDPPSDGPRETEESRSPPEVLRDQRAHRPGSRVHHTPDPHVALPEVRDDGCLQRSPPRGVIPRDGPCGVREPGPCEAVGTHRRDRDNSGDLNRVHGEPRLRPGSVPGGGPVHGPRGAHEHGDPHPRLVPDEHHHSGGARLRERPELDHLAPPEQREHGSRGAPPRRRGVPTPLLPRNLVLRRRDHPLLPGLPKH